jgi:hypothetical protein
MRDGLPPLGVVHFSLVLLKPFPPLFTRQQNKRFANGPKRHNSLKFDGFLRPESNNQKGRLGRKETVWGKMVRRDEKLVTGLSDSAASEADE